MLRVEIIKDYMEHYKIETKIMSFEDVAKILVKCKILDKRTTRYNVVGYSFDELLYNELMDIRDSICFSFMLLLEYSLYFEQEDEKLEMIEPIYQAMSFLVHIMNKTGIKRKNCRYKNVIQTIMKYEKDFYDDNLRNCNQKEKEIFIKNDLIEHTGEFLFNLEYYRLVENTDKVKSEEYWEAIMKLVATIDKVGEQKNIEPNEDIDESIRRKTLTYLTKNNKKPEDIFEYEVKST